MRTLWNQLVATFTQRQLAYHNAVAAETHASAKPSSLALRQLQQSFLRTTEEVSKASPVTWANKQFVTTQFFAALTRYFKKQGDPPRPRHGEFRELHFHHRFTEGGLPVERIFGHSQRLSLVPVAPETFSPELSQRQQKRLARTSGVFQVNGCAVKFNTILHRPFPSNAYLKAAALIGKRTAPHGYHEDSTGGHATPPRWQWSLQLTLEIPPLHHSVQEHKTTAALQIRSELIDERHVSFAIVTDPTGREEMLFLPEEILDAWHHKLSLQRQAHQLLEVTRQQLQDIPPAKQPPGTHQRFAHLNGARAPSLWRLLHTLEDEGAAHGALPILRHWASSSTKLLREARGVEQHSLGHRDWYYHNVAHQLCHRYKQIVISGSGPEGTPTQEHLHTASGPEKLRRYQQLAAPARFLSFLQQAAGKTGTTVEEERQVTSR